MTHTHLLWAKKFFRRGLQKVPFAEDTRYLVQTLLLKLDEEQHTLHHI